MKIGSVEIGVKSIKKRTPITLKRIGDSFLAFAGLLQTYSLAILADPVYYKVMTSYLPEKYTKIATLVCVGIKLFTMFTSRPDEIPVYPAPPELIKDENVVSPNETDNL